MNEKLIEIINQSCKMFAKYGIKSVSMDDIAKACGISKKTLYEHVEDKNELVNKVVTREFEENSHVPHSINMDDKNAIETLFILYKHALEFFKDFNFSMEFDLQKYYPSLYKKTKKNRRAKLYNKMFLNMTQGREQGFFREDFNIDIICKIHVIKIEALLQTDIFDADDYSTIDIFKELFLYHVYAIATPKGMDELNIRIRKYEQEQNQ
jgi:AcrR family transcriptional regulator